MKNTPTSFSLNSSLVSALKQKSYELSMKTGKRVTITQIVTDALIAYGIKPKKEKQ